MVRKRLLLATDDNHMPKEADAEAGRPPTIMVLGRRLTTGMLFSTGYVRGLFHGFQEITCFAICTPQHPATVGTGIPSGLIAGCPDPASHLHCSAADSTEPMQTARMSTCCISHLFSCVSCPSILLQVGLVSTLLLLLLDFCHIEGVSCLPCKGNLEHFGSVCILLVTVNKDAQYIDAVKLHNQTSSRWHGFVLVSAGTDGKRLSPGTRP